MFDFLVTPTTHAKARRMLNALAASCPADHRTFEGGSVRDGATLVLYGMGAQDRYRLALDYIASGGNVLTWDVGYWDRKGNHLRKQRVSLNGMHPPAYIMKGHSPGPQRFMESGLVIQHTGISSGPIVLVGNGPKSNVLGAHGWARAKSLELRRLFPGQRVIYRPKPKRPHENGVICNAIDEGPIDDLLKRASLVVCRHSNVAVDACRLGVPVVCEDGAAAAIYPHKLKDKDKQPTTGLRRDFLHRLAWWQWSPEEAERGLPWPWLLKVLEHKE